MTGSYGGNPRQILSRDVIGQIFKTNIKLTYTDMCSILPAGRQMYNFSSLSLLKFCANEGRAKLAWAMPSAAKIMQIILNIIRHYTEIQIIQEYQN